MQHGVKRVRYTKEALEEKRKREQAKLKEYLELTEEVISRVSQVYHSTLTFHEYGVDYL